MASGCSQNSPGSYFDRMVECFSKHSGRATSSLSTLDEKRPNRGIVEPFTHKLFILSLTITQPIFPLPPRHPEKRRIALTRDEVIGTEDNRFDGLVLLVDDLRADALKAMRKMHLNPAS
jgi:hypothetical protein